MANALSVRRQLRDEELAENVYLSDGSRVDFDSAQRLIILVHGYNNSEEAARAAFGKFRRQVGAGVPQRELWEFHWPGDHPIRFISRITYPARVLGSESVGLRLARFLHDHPRFRSVSLVAHSLGCRVTLEAIAAVRAMGDSYAGPPIEHVFLLAAAVPVPMCVPPPFAFTTRRFGSPWRTSEEHIFYSRSDRVLRWGFGFFQRFAATSEEGPAVGVNGFPLGRWKSTKSTGLRHGEYWESAIVRDEFVRRIGTSGVARLAEQQIPHDTAADGGRVLGSVDPLRRRLPERFVS